MPIGIVYRTLAKLERKPEAGRKKQSETGDPGLAPAALAIADGTPNISKPSPTCTEHRAARPEGRWRTIKQQEMGKLMYTDN